MFKVHAASKESTDRGLILNLLAEMELVKARKSRFCLAYPFAIRGLPDKNSIPISAVSMSSGASDEEALAKLLGDI